MNGLGEEPKVERAVVLAYLTDGSMVGFEATGGVEFVREMARDYEGAGWFAPPRHTVSVESDRLVMLVRDPSGLLPQISQQ